MTFFKYEHGILYEANVLMILKNGQKRNSQNWLSIAQQQWTEPTHHFHQILYSSAGKNKLVINNL